MHELACVAYADPRRLFGPDGRGKRLEEVDEARAAALARVEIDEEGRIVGFRFWDKVAALGMAMRHPGLFEKDNRQAGQSCSLQVVLVGGKGETEPVTVGSGSTYPAPRASGMPRSTDCECSPPKQT